MKKLEKIEQARSEIRHQDYRLRCLNRDLFDEREIASIERTLKDCIKKMQSAIEIAKKAKLNTEDLSQRRLKKSIEHYKKSFDLQRAELKEKIEEYKEA
jgi:ribosomal protein L17